jgi:hypothetical protein
MSSSWTSSLIWCPRKATPPEDEGRRPDQGQVGRRIVSEAFTKLDAMLAA